MAAVVVDLVVLQHQVAAIAGDHRAAGAAAADLGMYQGDAAARATEEPFPALRLAAAEAHWSPRRADPIERALDKERDARRQPHLSPRLDDQCRVAGQQLVAPQGDWAIGRGPAQVAAQDIDWDLRRR